MSQQTSTISKFISLTSLGLLTSTSLTLTHLLLPTLSTLPTPQIALSALQTLRRRTNSLHNLLSNISLAALGTAWILSVRHARHPYLLWTGLPVLGVVGWGYMYPAPVTTPDITTTTGGGGGGSSVNGSRADVKGKGKARDMGMGMGDGSEDEDGWRDVDRSVGVSGVAVNGETVRDGLVAFRREMGIKGLVWGLAWGLAQVGIWGDRY